MSLSTYSIFIAAHTQQNINLSRVVGVLNKLEKALRSNLRREEMCGAHNSDKKYRLKKLSNPARGTLAI